MNKPLEYVKVSLMMLLFIAVSACTTHIALATVEKELDNQLDYTDKYEEQIREMEANNVY
mgnify:CR=1 FL=1